MPVSQVSPNVLNYLVGKGMVSIKGPNDTDFVDVGNCPTFEFTPGVEKLDHYSSRAGVKSKDRSVVKTKSGTLHLVLEEFTPRNLALALMGAVNDADPGAVSIPILSEDEVTVAIKFTANNEVGPKWDYLFPQVTLTPSAALSPISEDWAVIDISGEVLFQEADGNFGTVTGDFSLS